MAENKLDRPELHAARSRRQGHRHARDTPRTSAPTACCSASSCSARCRTRASAASTRAPRSPCPASRRSSRPTICPDLGGAERALTNEPFYAGEPILAVAAVDELTAAEAMEKIVVDLEPLPFVVDPLESLRPGGPNARTTGNAWGRRRARQAAAGARRAPIKTIKWTAEQFADEEEGRLPIGEPTEQWSYGDLDAGFKSAALVLDETFVVQSTGHQPMETRSAMAYWQNGKLYLHGSTQSVAQTVPAIARWVGIEPVAGRADQRVHRRRLRQQGRRRGVDGHSGAALEEGERAGDDAHQPRGRELHRPRAHEHDRPHQDRLREGRPHHRARSLHRPGQRIVRADGRSPVRRPRRVAHLPAARDAVARHQRAHQHAAALAAAVAGADAGQRHDRAGHHEGRQAARHRPGRDPEDQLAGRQGGVRSGGAQRPAAAPHERVRHRGARSRQGRSSSGTSARRAPASGRDRRCAASASRSDRTAPDRSAGTAS